MTVRDPQPTSRTPPPRTRTAPAIDLTPRILTLRRRITIQHRVASDANAASYRGGLHMKVCSLSSSPCSWRRRRHGAPQQLSVRPRQGRRAQRHGHAVEVDEPTRVDLPVGRRRQGRQDVVEIEGRPRAYWPVRWSKNIFKVGGDHRDFSPARDGSHRPPHESRRMTARERAAGASVAAEEDICRRQSLAFRGARVPAAWIDSIDSRAGDAGAPGFYRCDTFNPNAAARPRRASGGGRGTARRRRDPCR
jgi:hypothetical protein